MIPAIGLLVGIVFGLILQLKTVFSFGAMMDLHTDMKLILDSMKFIQLNLLQLWSNHTSCNKTL